MSNFFAELEAGFKNHADQPALILSGQDDWSYAELLLQINRAAAELAAIGAGAGDRVLVQLPKSSENLALYLACLKLGLVYVPLNTGYTAAELDYFVSDAEPVLYVGEQHRSDVVSATLQPRDAERLLVFSSGASTSDDLAVPLTAVRATDDLAAILYTSGTTGRSKGAMLSHGNLASNAHALSEEWGWQASDVLLNALPIFHVHGLFIASHCALLNATPMIFLEKFDASEVMARLPDATVMMGVPTFYTRLLGRSELTPDRVAHMRVFICGSAPLTEQTFEEWEQRTGHRILERYGMSETIINTSNPLQGERVAGTVGFALLGQQVRVADEAGVPVPTGEVGMIEVAGPNVFQGYWRMPEKTAEEIRGDGFFITGDLGVQAADGRLSIVGRSKDLVISGGYNVYPKEVEVALDDMAQVAESAVIGVPHPDFGEAVVAVIVPAAGEVTQAQVDAALGHQLARFKQPKRVMNVTELPRNTMGKVQKNLLREQYADLFRA
ncbi:MAG TPA: malonyl-CoA synthase [Gammaproteobacteria bacterium]|nr:malonyl-CoA synthase [Gammaproteobacteria bacterium]|tara:strand:- start:4501 stop:5994 length:1494 start_codon:yes stop_codon:yes gene_type:complete